MSPASPAEVARYRAYVAGEVDGIYLYEHLAILEESPSLKDVYQQLAAMERRHLGLWLDQLRASGADDSLPGPSRRARFLVWLGGRFGAETIAPLIKSLERRANDTYTGDPIAEAAGLPHDESTHARVFEAISPDSGPATGSIIGRLESRHRTIGGGNALRAAVLGANDGLVSNLALVAGVAGADPGRGAIILAGIAGLLAGAASMALGEWISVTSSREAAEAQLAQEAEEIALDPDSERDELALIYQAKGLGKDEANALATAIVSDPQHALSTLAREELGIVPEDLGSPWAAAAASFLLFAIGAVIPVIPFLIGSGNLAIVTSAAASGVGLFILGAGITLLTGRNALYGGVRQVVLGIAAAVITFVVGGLIGGATGV